MKIGVGYRKRGTAGNVTRKVDVAEDARSFFLWIMGNQGVPCLDLCYEVVASSTW